MSGSYYLYLYQAATSVDEQGKLHRKNTTALPCPQSHEYGQLSHLLCSYEQRKAGSDNISWSKGLPRRCCDGSSFFDLLLFSVWFYSSTSDIVVNTLSRVRKILIKSRWRYPHGIDAMRRSSRTRMALPYHPKLR